jgi:hypothetical protein
MMEWLFLERLVENVTGNASTSVVTAGEVTTAVMGASVQPSQRSRPDRREGAESEEVV